MRARDDNEKGIETRKTVCWPSPGCSSCGLLVDVKDDKIVRLRGNPQSPTQGFVCPERFPHLLKWLEHPGQLMYPLKRAGERGENKWQRVSWEQALDEIAEKLKNIKAQYGAESLTVTEGTYRSDIYGIRTRFLNLFGNPSNIGCAGQACGTNKVALQYVLGGAPWGSGPTISKESMSANRCFVFCGANIPGARPVIWWQLKKRLKEKSKPKVIVIDPRRIDIVDYADIWLQIRPGTDTALMMAWMNVIIAENLYDKEFIDEWTFGFDQLKQRVAEYTPERVAEITWISAEKIRESARMYATNKPSSITLG